MRQRAWVDYPPLPGLCQDHTPSLEVGGRMQCYRNTISECEENRSRCIRMYLHSGFTEAMRASGGESDIENRILT